MKIILILISSIFNMTDNDFETVLGKDISKASFMGITKTLGDNMTYVISEPKIQFLEKSNDHIGIATDKDKITQRILIHLEGVIDTTFYKIMSDKYGSDYDVMIMDEILSEDSSEITTEGSFVQTLKQSVWTSKKGTIKDDNISSILWDKEDFRIILFYNYDRNKIVVHFIKKE